MPNSSIQRLKVNLDEDSMQNFLIMIHFTFHVNMLHEEWQLKIIEVKSHINLHIWVYTTQWGPTDNYTFSVFNNREINLVNQNILNLEHLRSTEDSLRPLSDARLMKRLFICIVLFIFSYWEGIYCYLKIYWF